MILKCEKGNGSIKVLQDVLQGTEDNRLFPFLWMHGEDEETLRDELRHIRACGISSVCLESRPHPDFVGARWWKDVDVIMDEARRTGMHVWVLDDRAFPTGSANGMAEKAPDALRRRFVRERHIDVCGPLSGASILLQGDELTDRLLAITAVNHETQQIIEIPLAAVEQDALFWNIPQGSWRVYIFSQFLYGPHNLLEGYLNPLIRESTQILIDAVYQPHYAHYAADFGQTFAGFFSDEPGFYADLNYYSKIGDPDTTPLWTPTMAQELEQLSGLPIGVILTGMFADIPGRSSACKRLYMDHASALYRDNFCYVLGDWCRAHGVEYMGHTVEDNNAHARMGYGAGHFFRALQGQDYAGIDIVLNQIIPGMGEIEHTACLSGGSHGTADGEFFTYLLAQMAASQARLEPHKHGRTMCEIFGAFGWAEGTKMMKWMADFMLVRGINYFVPHAFSPREFPDADCPPHFYARGNNPQYLPFTRLCRYMNRTAHLLSGGEAPCSIAVLYHAEAEWTHRECMLSQVPARVLTQAQIPFDIVTQDLLKNAVFEQGTFIIGSARYEALVIPGHAVMTAELQVLLDNLEHNNVPYRFVGQVPNLVIDFADETALQRTYPTIEVTALAQWLKKYRLRTDAVCPQLRARQYCHSDGTVWMLTNEHPYDVITTHIFFPEGEHGVVYDAMDNTVYPLPQGEWVIGPYESRLVIFGENLPVATVPPIFADETVALPDGQWAVSLATAAEYPHMTRYCEQMTLQNFNMPNTLHHFSGILRYETIIEGHGRPILLDLGEVYETAQVWLNGEEAGLCIAPPYRFVLKHVREGNNHLTVEVRNTLGHALRDNFSHYLVQEPIGLIGPVTLTYGKR